MKKSANKKILTTVILGVFLIQALIPSAALAGTKSLDYDNPNKSGDNPFKLSLKGVVSSGLLTSIVGCTGVVDKIAKVTTDFAQKLTKKKATAKATKAESKSATANAVPVVDATHIEKNLEAHGDTQTDIETQSFSENCLKDIAITLAKNQLTAMTKYTMNWITTGFNGDPLYVRNVDSYVDSITTEILKKENDLFKDPANAKAYPYGRNYTMGKVESYKSSKDTYDSLKQDLTSYLSPGSTPQSFATNFSQGGWNGWLALTQHPENNPLGFNLAATENLAKQQGQVASNAQAEIARSGGVLDQKKCVEYAAPEPVRTTSGADTCGVKDRNGKCLGTPSNTNPAATQQAPKCIKYETVTPGSVIKAKIDTYINSPERQIELAKTLNDALNALFSALINKFEDQGLSSLSSKVNNFTKPVSGGFGSNSLVDSLGNPISSTSIFSNSDSNADINQSFDLTRDLGNKYVQPINSGSWDANSNTPEIIPGNGIKDQYYTVSKSGDTKLFAGTHHFTVGEKVYFDGKTWKVGVPKYIIGITGVFQTQVNYIKSTKKAETILPQVVPKLGELDYCIPGPNQNWASNSGDAKNAYSAYLSDVSIDDVEYRIDARDYGCFAVTCGVINNDYTVINLPDPTDYKKIFDDPRNLWAKITPQAFFYIIQPYRSNHTFGHNYMVVNRGPAEAELAKWVDLSAKGWNEYIVKAKEAFGIGSPMQSEFDNDGNNNPKFLPMAQAGLDLTKNIVDDDENIKQAIATNEDNIAQSSATIYKLTTIKNKVNTIILAAQKRRKESRDAAGLPAIPQICLDNEKVTYIDDGVLK